MNQRIISTNQNNRERVESIEKRIQKIAGREQTVRKEIEERLAQETEFLHDKLKEYISSEEFHLTFCNWTNCTFPQVENDWPKTKSKINKTVKYRFEELMLEWERKNQVYSEIHRRLVDEFLARLQNQLILEHRVDQKKVIQLQQAALHNRWRLTI